MKNILKNVRVRSVLPLVGLALCVVGIARFALAGSPADVRPSDIVAAATEVKPAQGVDARTEVPADAALVGGNGLVEPLGREVSVAGQLPGVIGAVLVKEGQFVEAGEPLVQFIDDAERGALAAAEGDVAAAAAELKRLTRGARSTEIESAIADAEAARSRAELSAATLGRIERLSASGAASPEELDRARAQAKGDQQTLESSDARRRQVLAGTRDEEVLAARGRLRAAEGRRDQARAGVDRLRVKAPSAGEVLQIKVQPGEYYTPNGTALLLLGDTRDLRVRMDVEERDLAAVVVGARAFVVADAFPARRFQGTVIEVGRRMGRKNVRSDDPTERIDTKIREVVIDVTDEQDLVSGLRVMAYVQRAAARAAGVP